MSTPYVDGDYSFPKLQCAGQRGEAVTVIGTSFDAVRIEVGGKTVGFITHKELAALAELFPVSKEKIHYFGTMSQGKAFG